MSDNRVKAAMGDKFVEFQKLARMVAEQPATRAYAESQMERLLMEMTPAQRIELRAALRQAGVR
jgi:hypothetical protein